MKHYFIFFSSSKLDNGRRRDQTRRVIYVYTLVFPSLATSGSGEGQLLDAWQLVGGADGLTDGRADELMNGRTFERPYLFQNSVFLGGRRPKSNESWSRGCVEYLMAFMF